MNLTRELSEIQQINCNLDVPIPRGGKFVSPVGNLRGAFVPKGGILGGTAANYYLKCDASCNCLWNPEYNVPTQRICSRPSVVTVFRDQGDYCFVGWISGSQQCWMG